MAFNVKKFLVFIIFAPILGALVLYCLTLIPVIVINAVQKGSIPNITFGGVLLFFLSFLFSYVFAFVPTLFVAMIASILSFDKKIISYIVLILTSAMISYLFFVFIIDPSGVGVAEGLTLISVITTLFLGYFTVYKIS